MKLGITFVLGLILCASASAADDTTCPDQPKVVCYFASWAFYREKMGKFTVNDINTDMCTHVVYTFSGLNLQFGIDSIDSNVDIVNGGFINFTSLKTTNPCLKTILAIGGWNERSRKYSVMVSTPKSREAFVESALRFLVTYDFDGLDVDWEYPTQRGGIPDDRDNFVQLLKLLHERLSKWELEVSIAVPVDKKYLEHSYNFAEIHKYVSHISIMAYDYTSTTSRYTGLMAPFNSIVESIEFLIRETGDPKKLILGLPSYARTYTLMDPHNHGIGARTNSTGRSGMYTREPGFLSYYELLQLLDTASYTSICPERDYNCYAYYKNDWFTYDTIETFSFKIEYALNKGLGGVMLWTIDTDDFEGNFGKKYVILSTIQEIIKANKALAERAT